MHRFWSTVIQPVLEAVDPRVVVEIGAERGANTAHILRHCRRHGAVAHVIDPLPKFDLGEWQRNYGDTVVFHTTLSLQALPAIAEPDVVLIDGDHNWYTVFNELKILEGLAAGPARFPLVLLHDVEWPYGRRDLYYDPDTIPARHRQSFQTLGMRPEKSMLVEDGGFNAGSANAIHEHTESNGVLTALEDFVAQSTSEFRVVRIPGLHGLAILASEQLVDRSPALAERLAYFESAGFLVRQCHAIEDARIQEFMRMHEKRRTLKRRIRQLESELAATRQEEQPLT